MDVILAHGTGNTFVVLPDLNDRITLTDEMVRSLADPKQGFGTDGVIRIGSGRDGAEGFMDYRNADGSVVEMCGNGVRVTAKYLVDVAGVTPDSDGQVVIHTRAGAKPVRITDVNPDGSVKTVAVQMGQPDFAAQSLPYLPVDAEADVDDLPLPSGAEPLTHLPIRTVSFGNPHAVTTVPETSKAPVTTIGPLVEQHERFPNRVNVGFAQIVNRQQIQLRVWERGVGETAACGSGACAAVAVHQQAGLLDDDVHVHVPGGTLRITRHADGSYTLTGDAVFVSTATIDPVWAAQLGLDSAS